MENINDKILEAHSELEAANHKLNELKTLKDLMNKYDVGVIVQTKTFGIKSVTLPIANDDPSLNGQKLAPSVDVLDLKNLPMAEQRDIITTRKKPCSFTREPKLPSLTIEQCYKIKASQDAGMSMQQIMEKYNIHDNIIARSMNQIRFHENPEDYTKWAIKNILRLIGKNPGKAQSYYQKATGLYESSDWYYNLMEKLVDKGLCFRKTGKRKRNKHLVYYYYPNRDWL